MERYDIPKYGVQMKRNVGYIAELGKDEYCHRFGGRSWIPIDTKQRIEGPTLLLVLDLHDPKLSSLSIPNLLELPLCSYINFTGWDEKQLFRIHPASKEIIVDSSMPPPLELLEPDDRLPHPIPEKWITLREMLPSEYPIDEELYWTIGDEFVGGSSFIRILGAPLWLQWVEEETCSCGQRMEYVCCIGYEQYDKPGGFIENKPFFLGELGLYFFLCKTCLKIAVISQST